MKKVNKKTTNFYTIINHRLESFSAKLIKEKITPWVFMIHNGIKIEKEDGSFINYKGMGFEGNPRDVFWNNFIEPFLKKEYISIMKYMKSEILKSNINIREIEKEIKEIQILYMQTVTKIYNKMADVDQNLRGKGNPQNVEKVDVSDKIEILNLFINEYSQSILNLIKSQLQNLKSSQKLNKFYLILSIIAAICTIVGVIIQFIFLKKIRGWH